MAVISVLSKKLSPTQIHRCLSAHTIVGPWGSAGNFSTPQTPLNAGKFVSMVHFPSAMKLWAFAPGIKAATMKFGYIWISLTNSSYEPREKHEQQLFLRERSTPYQHRKVTCKADDDESDHSLSSEALATIRFRHSSVHTCKAAPMSTIEGTHDRESPRPSFFDLMRPRHLCLSLLSRRVPIHCTASCSFISHSTLRS